jgi:predicted aminopeptidase
MTRIVRGAGLMVVLCGVQACSAPYFLRVAYEEARILWRREPIVELLTRDDLASDTRDKLAAVLAAREFAEETLGFDVGRSYTTLARVDDSAVAYIVTAAYQDRLEPYTWRYPIVGHVPYRGFFDRGRADAYAAALAAQGLDTAVWPSVAFSTLGWFDDPVLSNMLESDPVDLVTVVFHELTHVQLYVASAATFNESLANFAGHRAAIAFFCATAESGTANDPPTRCAEAKARWRDERAYAAVLGAAAGALRALYAKALPADERREHRARILASATEAIGQAGLEKSQYRASDLRESNNAVLLQQLLYRTDLDLFEEVWEAEGRDVGRTVRWVIERVEGEGDPFDACRRQLGAASAPGAGRLAGGVRLGY